MALIKCKECEKEISDKAATCPGCGAPVATSIPPIIEEIPDDESSPINLEAIGFITILVAFTLPFAAVSSNTAWTIGFIGLVVFIMGRFQK
jgi:hypothetical protein